MLEHVESFENVNNELLIKFGIIRPYRGAKYYVLRYF